MSCFLSFACKKFLSIQHFFYKPKSFKTFVLSMLLVFIFFSEKPLYATANNNFDEKIERAFRLYKNSSDKERNPEDLKFLQDAADEKGNNNPLAQYYIGWFYLNGTGDTPRASAKAARNFYLAARLPKHAKIQEARTKLLSMAKKQNSMSAQYYCGHLYSEENGIEINLDTASSYFYKAACQGGSVSLNKLKELADQHKNPVAQVYWGILLYKREEVNKNKEQALKYFFKSLQQNNEKAREKLLEFIEDNDNKNLKQDITKEICRLINEKEIPLIKSSGRVAFFRGIHFVKNKYPKIPKIDDNFKASDLCCAAAHALSNRGFLGNAEDNVELLAAGEVVNRVLNKFRGDSPTLYNKFHEIYTNNHKKFYACLRDPREEKEKIQIAFKEYRWIFQNFTETVYPDTWQQAVEQNPFVSFSCVASHALRYGFGQKSFVEGEEGEEVKLSPQYNKKGEPDIKHLGMLYIAILSPMDIWYLNPTFVVDKHAQEKVKISTHPTNNILTESEVSFFGYMPVKLIKSCKLLETPRKSIDFDKAIEESDRIFDDEASNLIRKDKRFRIYSDVFINFYTHIAENSAKIRVCEWLHAVNAKRSVIASTSTQGDKVATVESIALLSANLCRQPVNLPKDWAKSLKTISIAFCELNSSGQSFSNILSNNCLCLEELSLRSCKLGKRDTLAIAKALSSNECLLTLILDDNMVGNKGAAEFATSLEENATLKRLSLLNTKIDNISCFADLFPRGGKKNAKNTTLIELNLNLESGKDYITIYKKIQKGLHRNLEYD